MTGACFFSDFFLCFLSLNSSLGKKWTPVELKKRKRVLKKRNGGLFLLRSRFLSARFCHRTPFLFRRPEGSIPGIELRERSLSVARPGCATPNETKKRRDRKKGDRELCGGMRGETGETRDARHREVWRGTFCLASPASQKLRDRDRYRVSGSLRDRKDRASLPLAGAPGGEGRPIREARVASAVRR